MNKPVTDFPQVVPDGKSAPGLWRFCQDIYAEPGVEALCLHLQDQHQVNVLVLLWCAWLEVRGEYISSETLARAADRISAASEPTVAQLRQVRRYLKHHDLLAADVEQQVRTDILNAELAIEKHLLMQLQDVAEARTHSWIDNFRAAPPRPLDRLVADWQLFLPDEWLGTLRAAAGRAYADGPAEH